MLGGALRLPVIGAQLPKGKYQVFDSFDTLHMQARPPHKKLFRLSIRNTIFIETSLDAPFTVVPAACTSEK